MRVRRRSVWLFLLSVATIVVAGKLAANSAVEGHSIGVANSEDCEFRVDVPARLKSGGRLDLILTLANQGVRTRFWGDTNGLRDCILRVYDNQGRRVPYTPLGEEKLETAGYSTYRCVITELVPGESHEWRFDIAPFFQINPGKYTFTAWIDLDIPDGPRLKVQDVPFEVH